jgi:hypothetical protein
MCSLFRPTFSFIELATVDKDDFYRNIILHEYLHLLGYHHGIAMVKQQERITKNWNWFANDFDDTNPDNTLIIFSKYFGQKLTKRRDQYILQYPEYTEEIKKIFEYQFKI